jgi:hypothetical protein
MDPSDQVELFSTELQFSALILFESAISFKPPMPIQAQILPFS